MDVQRLFPSVATGAAGPAPPLPPAGTPVGTIGRDASAAGRVECVIAKPLPLTPATFATLPAGHVAHAFQVDGEKRLAALARWIDDVDDGDALSAWTTEPATKRLDFAALHSGLG